MAAIVIALAIPGAIGALQSYRLRSAAWQVAGHVRLARQKAVSNQKDYRVTFNRSNAASDPNTYLVERNDGTVSSPVWANEFGSRFSFPPGVQIDPTSLASVTFDPKGIASTAGTVKLVSVAGEYDVSLDVTGRAAVTKK